MKLPNASAARVDFEKVRAYLLSETHPVGRAKAAFFGRLGFSADRPDELVAALLRIGRSNEVVTQTITRYGSKYVLDGLIEGAKGSAQVRTVWILERNTVAPRLVTAYAAPEGGT